MILKHICSALIAGYSLRRDVKEQKIFVLPAICLVFLGLSVDIYVRGIRWPAWIVGLVPGVICSLLSGIFGKCMGRGDCLLILALGLLEGFWFSMRLLITAFAALFIFLVIALSAGWLKRKSKVPFVPFLVIGYVGAWL